MGENFSDQLGPFYLIANCSFELPNRAFSKLPILTESPTAIIWSLTNETGTWMQLTTEVGNQWFYWDIDVWRLYSDFTRNQPHHQWLSISRQNIKRNLNLTNPYSQWIIYVFLVISGLLGWNYHDPSIRMFEGTDVAKKLKAEDGSLLEWPQLPRIEGNTFGK